MATPLHRIPSGGHRFPSASAHLQELKSHYFTAWLRRQFDLLVFRDTSSATEPIEDGAQQGGSEQNDIHQEDAQTEGA